MKVECCSGSDDVARVYVASFGEGKWIEFVESVQRPLPREKKWVLIVSSLFGCPVRCLMCDAGVYYRGKLAKEEIFSQIDYMVRKRFPGGNVAVEKFKIQFARMGEPSLNPAVLEVLDELPSRYGAAGLLPSLSTIAPSDRKGFFKKLLEIKQRRYSGGRFQLQFSIHTTDADLRDRLLPVKKWNLDEIAEYGETFCAVGDKKITLNFALVRGMPVDESVLLRHFRPDKFLVKITPLNPTYRAAGNLLEGHIDPQREAGNGEIFSRLRRAGYEVINSIGDLEENLIGSNCGQSVLKHLREKTTLAGGYRYKIKKVFSKDGLI